MLLFVMWALQQYLVQGLTVEGNPLFLPMAAFAAVIAAQIIFHLSQYQYVTRVEASKYLTYALLAFVASQVYRGEREIRGFLVALTVFGGAVALFAVIQDLSSNGAIYWLRVPREGGAIFGPYVNRNHYAGLMEMLTAIPLVLGLSRRYSTGQRALFALSSILMAGSVFLSGSRAGAATVLAQMLLVALLLGRKRRGAAALWTSAAVFVGVVALLFWLNGSGLLDRFTPVRVHDELSGGRLAISRDALRMWKHHPILGFGLGNFANFYPHYRSFYTDFFVNEVHNDYVQLLVETGVVGFAAGMWFVVVLLWRGMKGWLRAEGEPAGAQLACFVACAGILVHSFADFNLHIPANAALFYVLAMVTTVNLKNSYHRELPFHRQTVVN